uniref:Uncharacterized protein n=1 Tax=Denticeps clupeoides TaxID=299321 RepID=A0AAY4DPH6_9TELE
MPLPDADEVAPPIPPRRGRPVPKRRSPVPAAERRVTCVLVGDGAVGKTSLVVSYATNGFPAQYVPTGHGALVSVDGTPVRLQLCDVAGQDNFTRLRTLCYRNADVFLLCYSVVQPLSFRNVTGRWASEIQHFCPGVPIILVGTQSDLREDVHVLIQLAQSSEQPVSLQEAQSCSQSIGAITHTECSALTQKNLKEVFDAAIMASLQNAETLQQRQRLRRTPDKIWKLSESWWRKALVIQFHHSESSSSDGRIWNCPLMTS